MLKPGLRLRLCIFVQLSIFILCRTQRTLDEDRICIGDRINVYLGLDKGKLREKLPKAEDREAADLTPWLENIPPTMDAGPVAPAAPKKLPKKFDLEIPTTPVELPPFLQTSVSQKPSSNPAAEPTKIPPVLPEIKIRPRGDRVQIPEKPPSSRPTVEPTSILEGSLEIEIKTHKPSNLDRPTFRVQVPELIPLIPFELPQQLSPTPTTVPSETTKDEQKIINQTRTLLPINRKNPFWISETSTSTSADSGPLSEERFTFILTIFMSPVMLSLAPTFIPVNLRTRLAFIEISKNNQPMFMLFGVIHVICISDLITAFIEGVLLWKEIPKIGCEILGACRIIIFFGLSLILTIVCLLRISAILKPRQFKKFISHKVVLKIICGITIMTTLLAVLLIGTETLTFQYEGPPRFLGCTLFVAKDIFEVLAPILITIILFVNLALACTCWVLYRYFKKSDSVSVRDLKREALFVTSLSSLSYFLCHVPSLVTKVIMFIEPDLIMKLEPPYLLLVDFILILCSHLYSCLLPLCLVTSKAIDRVRLAADRNRLSRKTTLQHIKTEM